MPGYDDRGLPDFIEYVADAMIMAAVDEALLAEIRQMMFPVRATCCGKIYDLAAITNAECWLDCTLWRCPGCNAGVSDRRGSPDCRYIELEIDGDVRVRRRR